MQCESSRLSPLPSGSGLCGQKSNRAADECEGLQCESSRLSPLPSGSGLCGQKRSHSVDESGDGCPSPKVVKYDICKLIELPERETDPGSETEFSYQEESTDLCCRSSTCSSELSEFNAVGRIEFEVRSPEEVPNFFGDSSTDTSVNDHHPRLPKQTSQLPDEAQRDDAGNSTSSGSSDGIFDPEIPRRDYWTCLRCSNINNRPAFRYCEKCYKVRRDMFQPRLKPRKRRRRKTSKGASTATKGKSEKTEGPKKCQPDSGMYSGIKLASCSRENKDSGVACSQSSGLGCSQSTLDSSLRASGKDSDSSQTPDSGADTRQFHGIKLALSSTGGHSVKMSSLVLESGQCVEASVTRREVGVIGCRDCSRTVGDVQLSATLDEVDALQVPFSQGVDEVDALQVSVNRGVEVDALQVPVNRGVDEVDALQVPVNRGVDEVDALQVPVNRGVDEVGALQVPVNRGVDEVAALQVPVNRGVDEVDALEVPVNQGVDKVDGLWPSTSQSTSPVPCVQQSTRVGASKIDLPSVQSGEGPTSKRSVKTQTYLTYISKSGVPREEPSVDVDKCMTCYSRALDGIFVHSTYAHMGCCYKCTVKIWKTTKRCPLCNCKVMNVLRVFKGY